MNKISLGSTVIKLDNVDSTNTYAKRLMREKQLSEGTVILTDWQTKGRGQAGEAWESEPGKNLTFSIVIYPVFMYAEKQFFISMCISNGIIDFLQEHMIQPQIKWPNDICVGDMKIAGILIENAVVKNDLRSSVIGIGLNVNQQTFGDDLIHATSMHNITAHVYDLADALDMLLEKLTFWVNKLYDQAYGHIKVTYLNRLKALNEWRTYADGSGQFEGRIVDVSDSGELVIKKRSGTLHSYLFKEIS